MRLTFFFWPSTVEFGHNNIQGTWKTCVVITECRSNRDLWGCEEYLDTTEYLTL